MRVAQNSTIIVTMQRTPFFTQLLLLLMAALFLLVLEIIAMLAGEQPDKLVAAILHGATLILIILAVIAIRRRVLPIQKIDEWAKNLEAGRYTYKLELSGNPEIDSLILTLNRLAETIEQHDIELRTMNAALNARSQELAALSRQTIAVEEEERRRVSRELHDGLSQVMAAAKMTLDIAARLENPQKKDELLQEASKTVEQAIDELHTISQGLRPTILDDLGLKEALEWYIQMFEQRFKIPVEFSFHEIGALHLTPECEITAYRFLQEALTNVYKHAQASKVSIKMRHQANFVMLSVTDDGCGFIRQPPEKRGRLSLGLTGLQERLALVGGELIIHSQPERGTTLIALLPMMESQEAA